VIQAAEAPALRSMALFAALLIIAGIARRKLRAG